VPGGGGGKTSNEAVNAALSILNKSERSKHLLSISSCINLLKNILEIF